MTNYSTQSFNGTGRTDTRHSREDALSERQFERLLRACWQIDDEEIQRQTRIALHLTGRLGMRAGEAVHLPSGWIDERQRMIHIPEHDPCTKGRDGGLCGYCRNRARAHHDTMDVSIERAKELVVDELDQDKEEFDDDLLDQLAQQRKDDRFVSLEDAYAKWWSPKTDHGVRSIPYDFSVRTEMAIEEFVDNYETYPISKATFNRRINDVAERAGLEDNVYPHALRATSASHFAKADVSKHALMSIMGWADMQVAGKYIQSSTASAAREVRSKYR